MNVKGTQLFISWSPASLGAAAASPAIEALFPVRASEISSLWSDRQAPPRRGLHAGAATPGPPRQGRHAGSDLCGR